MDSNEPGLVAETGVLDRCIFMTDWMSASFLLLITPFSIAVRALVPSLSAFSVSRDDKKESLSLMTLGDANEALHGTITMLATTATTTRPQHLHIVLFIVVFIVVIVIVDGRRFGKDLEFG